MHACTHMYTASRLPTHKEAYAHFVTIRNCSINAKSLQECEVREITTDCMYNARAAQMQQR